SVGRKISRFWRTKIMKPQEVNMANIHDTLYRTTQVSFVPFVGTNRKLSGNVINDYSFNILGGYALGTQKLEIGSIFNVDRGNVNGIQFAGLFNTVGGRVKGVQLAGLFNANGDSLDGTQLAGLINVNLKGSKKFSGAGLINFTRLDSRAVQFAGLFNATIGAQRGPQVAGLFNFSTGSVTPLQWAGLWNFSAGNMKGAQVAGLWNFAGGEVTGGQVSGLLNYATRMKGAQVGLINISDSIRGVPVGFFSFSLKGYHKLEISADEIFYTNVAFRTGVRQFYNIFTAGAKPNTFENDTTFWTFGYGIGTAPRINKWLSLNFDLTANQLVHRAEIEEINLLNKLHVGCDVRLIKRVSLTFGVTLNAYITDTTYDGYIDIFTDYRPSIIYDHTYSNNVNMKMWWGGKVGLRFF
ncbi:MAG: LA_2272 family surface repeat-containing protein, partial [Bacteroidota bacterium]